MKSDAFLHMRIPTKTKKAAEKRAAALGLSLSAYIVVLINQDAAGQRLPGAK